MNKSQENLLQKTIELHERNLQAGPYKHIDIDAYSSPLCKRYYDHSCEGCPIAIFTHSPWCLNTPLGTCRVSIFDEHAFMEDQIDCMKDVLQSVREHRYSSGVIGRFFADVQDLFVRFLRKMPLVG